MRLILLLLLLFALLAPGAHGQTPNATYSSSDIGFRPAHVANVTEAQDPRWVYRLYVNQGTTAQQIFDLVTPTCDSTTLECREPQPAALQTLMGTTGAYRDVDGNAATPPVAEWRMTVRDTADNREGPPTPPFLLGTTAQSAVCADGTTSYNPGTVRSFTSNSATTIATNLQRLLQAGWRLLYGTSVVAAHSTSTRVYSHYIWYQCVGPVQ